MIQSGPFTPLDSEAGALLVDSFGAEEFGPGLLSLANSSAEVEEVFAYLVRLDDEPFVLVSQSNLPGSKTRVSQYVDRFYRHDPAVRQIWSLRPGESFMQRTGTRSIIPSDYRRTCFGEPGFTEKLSFGWRAEHYVIVLSFYRQQPSRSESLTKLSALASLTLAILVKHHLPVSVTGARALLCRRLRRAFPLLSPKEVEVCARTILGWSAKAIGNDLGISPGTVLTYRQRAYQKTGFQKAGDFVPAILN